MAWWLVDESERPEYFRRKRAKYLRGRRAELRRVGLCVQCSSKDAESGSVRCSDCKAYQRAWMAKKRGDFMILDGEQAKLARAAAVLNPYGKRTSKPEPGQTWRVRVPRSARSEAMVERDGIVLERKAVVVPGWYMLQVAEHARYVHINDMLYMVAGAPVRVSMPDPLVMDHDLQCHYRIAATHGAADACPHGCDDALDCEHCYPCTCRTPEEAAA